MRIVSFASTLLLALTLGASACGGSSTARATSSAAASQPASLYTRLGAKPAIEAVIDKFLDNVAADARINGFFAHLDAAGVAKLRGHLVDQVCSATGGPCQYTGKDMVTAHTGMNITAAHFDALVEDLATAMTDLGVKETESSELLGVLAAMKGDIVDK